MKGLTLLPTAMLGLVMSAGNMFAEPPVSLAEITALLRKIAPEIERIAVSNNPEAAGLERRIQDFLELKLPGSAPAGSVRQQLAAQLESEGFVYSAGGAGLADVWAGHEFDPSPEGREERMLALQTRASQHPEDTALSFMLWETASALGREKEAVILKQGLLAGCQEQVTQHPEDAEAHARLAEAWQRVARDAGNAQKSAAKALELDADQPRARLVRLRQRYWQWLALEGQQVVGPAADQRFAAVMFATPFDDARYIAFQKEEKELLTEAEAVIDSPQTDLACLLRATYLLHRITLHGNEARACRSVPRPAGEGHLMMQMLIEKPQTFATPERFSQALSLAHDNPEIIGALLNERVRFHRTLVTLYPQAVKAGIPINLPDGGTKTSVTFSFKEGLKSATTPLLPGESAEEMRLVEDGLRQLANIGRKSEGLRSAMAYEAHYRVELLAEQLDRRMEHPEFVLKSLELAPARFGTLTALVMVAKSDPKSSPVLLALAEARLAMMPSYKIRLETAAAYTRQRRWSRAEELLRKCVRESPDDPWAWNQRIVNQLQGDASDQSMALVRAWYDKARSALGKQPSVVNDERLRFVRNYLLFSCMDGQWDSAIETAESYRKSKLMPEADADKVLQLMRELRPQ
jgi:tetratricopeptide (TPR) repeat protein